MSAIALVALAAPLPYGFSRGAMKKTPLNMSMLSFLSFFKPLAKT
jgi:hypothetical protein